MAFQMAGIDVSHWQGKINFHKVKKAGIQFVIIKAGGSDAHSRYKDVNFDRYYKDAKAAGLHVGAYYFVGKSFYLDGRGLTDAQHFLRLLEGKVFDMPVYIDVETCPPKEQFRTTNQVIDFCDWMEKHNAFVGVYASDIAGFDNMLQKTRLEKYTWWVSRYGGKPKNIYGIYQWTPSGRVNGITGKVDRNKCVVNFPEIIKRKGLNQFHGHY